MGSSLYPLGLLCRSLADPNKLCRADASAPDIFPQGVSTTSPFTSGQVRWSPG